MDTKSAFCLDLGVVQAGVGEGGAQAGGGAAQGEVGEEGVAQVGAGEGGPQAGDGAVGEVDHAAVLAQSTSVKKAQPAFQMHRDLNAASNLWNVLAAECARLPRPAYLTRLQLHSCL